MLIGNIFISIENCIHTGIIFIIFIILKGAEVFLAQKWRVFFQKIQKILGKGKVSSFSKRVF